ncbi:MAG: superoxide dismutase family protein [Christensenellaceae bacterium]|nr:superoxide dismutase family protein [Christensenellaceae bacterium]PWM63827.1 MAG: superoxide dismutase family protein [Clostridia bacterium]
MQNNRQKAGIQTLFSGLGANPGAVARVSGDAAHPQLRGVVRFYPAGSGTLVLAEFHGLPYDAARCAENIFAMHIHTNGSCAGDGGAFAGAGGHYNPAGCPHPAHAGDLPPLFSNRGYAFSAVYTERFTVREILQRTVILHSQRDDFTSQPAGDAGSRIGCGIIEG